MTDKEKTKVTEQESNFMGSFIWHKPKYKPHNPLSGMNAIHVSKLYNADNPYFLENTLFLSPFINEWIPWSEKFRDELKKHYATPSEPKEEEFDVKAYVKSLVETPEYLERCKEVDPIIEILEAYKNGEKIERKEKYSPYEWSELWKGHVWNFSDFDYKISGKQPEAIPATEEELKEIDRGMICIKNKQTGQFGWVMKTDPIPEGMYIFDKQTKTWQDWGSK